MAKTRSPGVKMIDDYLTANSPQAGDDGPSVRRRWNCPSEEMLASYLDEAMGSEGRGRIESHLVDCEYCRTLVADVVRLRRLDATPLPLDLTQKAIALVAQKSRRPRWILWPAAAMAGTAFAVIIALMLRSPQQLILHSPSTPAPPVIAKSEPAPAVGRSDRDIVRKLAPTSLLPTLISPKQDNVIKRDQLEFKWKPVPASRYYEVHVVTFEGDLVWEGQSDRAVLKFPGQLTLKDGRYFVWISAYLDDGRVQKSAPVRFLVTASR